MTATMTVTTNNEPCGSQSPESRFQEPRHPVPKTPASHRDVITQLATCSFIDRQHNVVFQGFTGSGKSYLGSALANQACTRRIRAHYVRMPDLEEAWFQSADTLSVRMG